MVKIPVNQINSRIKEFLEIERINYDNKIPDTSLFDFYYNFPYSNKLKITVAKQLINDYSIDIVSTVSFSPIHVTALNAASKEEINKMLNDLFHWLTPREPEYFIILEPDKSEFPEIPENEEINPFYVVRLPIYTDNLTLSNFMRTLRLVSHSSLLARKLIVTNLNPIAQRLEKETT